MSTSGAHRRVRRSSLVLLQLLVFVTYIFGPTSTFAEDPSPAPSPTESTAPEPSSEPTPAPSSEPTAPPAPTPAPSEPDPTASPDPTPAPPEPDPTPSPDPEPTASPEPDSTPAPAPGTRPYLITFASGTEDARQLEILGNAGVTDESAIPQLSMRSVLLHEGEYVDELAALRANADVVSVDLDRTRAVEAAPSDTSYADQWALPQVGWDQLYGTVGIGGSATVAVLDTGVDAAHQDLDGVVLPGTSVLDGSNGLSDPNGHGTWMAGIVAAETDNAFGIAGTAYAGVSVLPVTVLGADGTGQDSDIIAGVVYAADAGADVILMSFSNPGYSPALQAAIDYAWNSGAVLVAATGNDGSSTATFPAGDRGVIGVTSTDSLDALAVGANYGPAAFMAAPGVDITTTSSGGSVAGISGTSAAAAQVAGAAALLSANEPFLSNGVIVSRLARNADPAGDPTQTGNGRLNLARAMADASTDSIQPAGAAPVGGGGPLIGPYVVAAPQIQTFLEAGFTTDRETFERGDTIFARASSLTTTVSGGGNPGPNKAYRFRVLDSAGVTRQLGACFTATVNTASDSYVSLATDPLSDAASWKYQILEFDNPSGATTALDRCNSGVTADDTDEDPFELAQAYAFASVAARALCVSDATCAAAASGTFSPGSTVYVRVRGYAQNQLNTSDRWIRPNGTTACENLAGTDRPDSDAAGTIDTAFPLEAAGEVPNAPGCPAITAAASDTGQWRLLLSDGGFGTEKSIDLQSFNAAANAAPVCSNGSASTNEDTALNASVTCTDADGNTLTYSVVTGPANGSLTSFNAATGAFTYQPNANYNGPDSFTFKANDGTVDSNTATFSITVNSVNDAPTANAQSQTFLEDSDDNALTLTGSTGPANESGQVLTFVLDTLPANGTLSETAGGSAITTTPHTLADANIFFTPDEDYCTTANDFDFHVTDNGGGTDTSAPATVDIDVTCVNDEPTANAQSQTFVEDSIDNVLTLTGSEGPLNESGQVLTFILDTLPANGTLSETSGGPAITTVPHTLADPIIYFTPNPNYCTGANDFDFHVTDDGGIANGGDDTSPTALVDLTVTCVNDAPTANAQSQTFLEDSSDNALTLTGSTGPANESAQVLTFILDTLPANGTLSETSGGPAITTVPHTLSNSTIFFTPDADYCTTANDFDFHVTDNGGTANGGVDTSSPATVDVDVTCINDAPTADAQVQTFLEDSTDNALTLTGSTGPANESAQVLTFVLDTLPANGSLSETAGGSAITTVPYTLADPDIFFTPNANYCTTLNDFNFHVSDDGGIANGGVDISSPATVDIDVTCVNDAPVLDLDGPLVAGIDNSASFTEDAGPTTLAPNATVSDVDDTDLESAMITLTNRPDGIDESLSANALICAPITVTAYNSSTGELALSGTASLADYQDCLRTIAYDNADQDPDATNRIIEWTVFDGDDDSAVATTTLTITPVNDAPVVTVTGDTDVDEGDTETYTFSTVDPDSSSFSVVGDPDCGTSGDYVAASLVFNSATGGGTFDCSFPDDDPTVTPSDLSTVSITISDGTDSGTGTLDVTVNNVAPTVTVTGDQDVNEGDTETYSFTVDDPGSDTFSLVGDPDCGDSGDYVAASATINPLTGAGSFQCSFPDDDPTGTASDSTTVSVTVADDDTGQGTGTLDVTVNNVAPTVTVTGPSPVNESQALRTYLFDTTDQGTLDAFTAGTPDCGTGVFVGPIVFDGDTGDGSFDCRFADDDPTGTSSDLTSVSITITDDDSGAGTGSQAVTVNNVAPSVSVTGPSPVNESQTLRTYLFDTTDPGVNDTFSAGTPDCGTGAFVGPIVFSSATGDGSFDCRFADDDPTATPSDITTVSITITDDDTGAGTGSKAVTVNNVAPSVSVTGPSPVNESQTLHNYVFDTTDPGTADTFTAGTPNCGSGVFVGPIVFSSATGDGNFNCRFADDNPSGTPSDSTTVSITITDDDTGAGTGSQAVTVNNVAPSVSVTGPSPVAESQTLRTYLFDTTDPGVNDTFSAGTPNCGSGVFVGPIVFNPATGDGSFDCRFADDNPTGTPSDVTSVSITITDDDTGAGTGSQSVTVNNVNPTIVSSMVTYSPGAGTVTSTVTYSDQGVPDTERVDFQYVVTNGGTTTTTHTAGPGLPSSATVADTLVLDPGCYTIQVTISVTDDDTGSAAVVHNVGSNLDFFDAQFRPPIKEDERNIAKYGNVVPVKVELMSMCFPGTTLTNVPLHITIVLGNQTENDAVPDTMVAESVSNADTGTQMRISGGGYIYNLSTRGMQKDNEYTIRIREGSNVGPIILRALFMPKK